MLPTQIYKENDSRFEDRRVQVLAVYGHQGYAVCRVVVHNLTPRAIGKKVKIRLDRLLREPHLKPFYTFVSGPIGEQEIPDWPATMRPQSPVSHHG